MKTTTELDRRIAGIQAEWSRYAKEPVMVERIAGAFYAFGSELATLRLLKVFRNCEHARQNFSKGRNEFFFSLETPNIDFDQDGKMNLVGGGE